MLPPLAAGQDGDVGPLRCHRGGGRAGEMASGYRTGFAALWAAEQAGGRAALDPDHGSSITRGSKRVGAESADSLIKYRQLPVDLEAYRLKMDFKQGDHVRRVHNQKIYKEVSSLDFSGQIFF